MAQGHPGPDEPLARGWALYGGLALTTCSMLLVQQFLTRAFTILFNSGLAFLAISITFLGLGSAGVCVCALPRVFDPQRVPRLVPRLALAYSAALVAGFVALIAVDHGRGAAVGGMTEQVRAVVGSSLLVLPAMFLVGLVIALVLREHSARVGKLYGADLVGGGVGCLLVLPLMRFVGGDQGIFFIGALAALGAALLAHVHERRVSRGAALAGVLVYAALAFANRGRALVDVRSHSTALDSIAGWVIEDPELGREWNELSRLGFFATRGGSAVYVRIDSSCQTTIPSQAPEHVRAYVDSTDFERLPYALDRHRRYLEIGAGGGRGMLLAQAQGAESITGVEINPGIVDAALLPMVFQSALIGWAVAAKLALSAALIFPLAFVMGMFFPHGIRLVDAAAPQLTPWAWGANSATSVVGSILALILAIHFGFASVALVAAATYALWCLPAGWVLQRLAPGEPPAA